MKKLISIVLSAAGLFALASCGSTKGIKGMKVVANRAELVDWQGASIGKDVPKWVECVNDGNNKGVAKALGIDEKQEMIFVLDGRGSDLDFVKIWVDNVDARREVSTSISQIVATTTTATLSGMQNVDGATKEKMYNDATQMASAIELNGLLKGASYWVKTRTLKVGANSKRATDADYSVEYTYFVVFTINREIYEDQLNSALKTLEDNTSEEAYLKRVLAEKLSQTILPGNTLGTQYNGGVSITASAE